LERIQLGVPEAVRADNPGAVFIRDLTKTSCW